MDDIKKILIYRTDRYGDFLISSPFIKSLKLKFPNSKIHIMCSSYNENLIKNFSFIDKHFVFTEGFFYRFLMVFNFLFKKYDYLIILDGKRRSLFHALFLRGKIYCLIKNKFLVNLCKLFNIIYVINSEVHPQFVNFKYLANLIGFDIKNKNIYDNYKFGNVKFRLPRKFIVFHLDEKWFTQTYYFDYTDINPDYNSIFKILNYIQKKNYHVVITTGAIKLNLIEQISNFIHKHKFLSKNVTILDNTSFHEIQYLISKSKALICCEGGVSHVSYFFDIPTLALYEKSRKNFYNYWTGHMKKIILHPRENAKVLTVPNSTFYKNLSTILS
jgi:heptosyltransferase-3